ncbi:hypothetical protein B0H17DRAFT_1138249 [Mycena rosella]|uniref:Uncharacterized protein n=1 Tax=Mycena rosella TaxID=1033263 RepID=A0AAD7GDQ6_MYCRO|nr:hypothetical protein B0H17DRAFT_1138249 [Mycena rosella]
MSSERAQGRIGSVTVFVVARKNYGKYARHIHPPGARFSSTPFIAGYGPRDSGNFHPVQLYLGAGVRLVLPMSRGRSQMRKLLSPLAAQGALPIDILRRAILLLSETLHFSHRTAVVAKYFLNWAHRLAIGMKEQACCLLLNPDQHCVRVRAHLPAASSIGVPAPAPERAIPTDISDLMQPPAPKPPFIACTLSKT